MLYRQNRKTHFTLNETREMNKHSLATYAMDKWYTFDLSVDDIIQKLEFENKKALEEHLSWEDLHKNNRDRFMEIADQTGMSESELLRQNDSHLIDMMYRDEEMVAFAEMKIIFAFKHLEINIKRLIASAYFGTPTRDYFNWENLKTFFKSKSIIINTLECYKEVEQLRVVNNFLKHSINIDELSSKEIPEFKDQALISYPELNSFYNRIKKFPNKFLESLSLAIYNEEYEFSEPKLDDLAESFALRMDKQTAFEFCKKLGDCYRV
jgi:hypothetical protein